MRPLLVCGLVLLSVTAWAGFDEGLAAAARGDYATALRKWRPLAQQGDAPAQYSLGVMYAKGWGVPQDFAQALMWYRRAAEQGYASAQYNLGNMSYDGRGVPQDYAQAMMWYRRAAEQGYAEAMNSLGVMYAKGEGVVQDYVQAHRWFNLAAAHHPPVEDRGRAVRNRDRAAAVMTAPQIAEAQKLAREWKPKTWDELKTLK